MACLRYLLVVAFLLAPAVVEAAKPTRLAVIYALPPDGAWIEFQWTLSNTDGKSAKGTLRLSSVGSKIVDDIKCRWIEIRKEYRQDGVTKLEYRKLLVEEKAFAKTADLREHVRILVGQEDSGAPTVFSESRRRDFLNMGLDDPNAPLKEIAASETVTTKLGKFDARRVCLRSKSGTSAREYHGWLTPDVPFGCVRFEIHRRNGAGPKKTIFTAVAVRQGSDAKAEVDESKAR
jgi:hypothetical protein